MRAMRRPPVPAALLALAVALGAGGCGNDRTPAPDTATPLPPQGSARLQFPDAGVSLAAPGRWDQAGGQTPLVATMSSGRATVAVWRFARAEPLPRSADDLQRARRDLIKAAKARDPSFRERSVRVREVHGHRALEVRGTGTIEGQARDVRSLHVFAFGGEVVVDGLAPPGDFARVDQQVFGPVMRSLRLARPRGGA
jgi:hypothetical protein